MRGRTPVSRTAGAGCRHSLSRQRWQPRPAFACDPALQAVIAEHPERSDDRDALARSCARAGRFDEALAHYDRPARRSMPTTWTGCSASRRRCSRCRRPREALPLLERGRGDRAGVRRRLARQRHGARVARRIRARAMRCSPRPRAPFRSPTGPWRAGGRSTSDACWSAARGSPSRRQPRGPVRRTRPPGRARRSPSSSRSMPAAPARRPARRGAFRHAGRAARARPASSASTTNWSLGVTGDVSPDAEVLPEWSLARKSAARIPAAAQPRPARAACRNTRRWTSTPLRAPSSSTSSAFASPTH